jgi:hypothetical protein
MAKDWQKDANTEVESFEEEIPQPEHCNEPKPQLL